MTHGHEQKWGNAGGKGCAGWRGIKGGKWDNCNSIINKIYVLKRMQRAAIYFRIIYVCEHLHL